MRVLAFGEILWDIIEGVEHLGGAPFNFAAHAAQCGNEAFIISRLGGDFLGMRAYNLSKSFGVNISLIQWDDVNPTGVVDVILYDGQPDYTIRKDSAYDYIACNDALRGLNKAKFDVFYFGSLAQRNETSAETLYTILSKHKFQHVFYDVNLRKSGYTDDIVRKSLFASTIFKLNVDEVPVVSKILVGTALAHEEFCKCVKSLYPNINTIIITASERGCYVYQDQLHYAPGNAVTVKDAVGAGDAFSASFMHTYAMTGDAIKSVKIANQVGAFVATRTGAIPEYSSQIMNLLNINSKRYTNAAQNIL